MVFTFKEAREYKEGFKAGQIDMLEALIKNVYNMGKDNIELYELNILLKAYRNNDKCL